MAAVVTIVATQQSFLTDEQTTKAIVFGQQGNDLSVHVGTVTMKEGTCIVLIAGPAARIAAAAAAASRRYRPFTLDNVTPTMKELTYAVSLEDPSGSRPCIRSAHVVLQPQGARGMDGVIQPLREEVGEGAFFDRFPDGPFQVVVALRSGDSLTVPVSSKDRIKIESTVSEVPLSRQTMVPAPPRRAAESASTREVTSTIRLLVQGDGRHLPDAIQAFLSEFRLAGIVGSIVQRGHPYDFMIAFGEGQQSQSAAAATALDPRGDVVAIVVRGAFTQKGAAEGVGRDLARKLMLLTR
jgi:hypothetical protein